MMKRVGIVLSLLGLTLLVMMLVACSGGARTSVQEKTKEGASVVAFNDDGVADQALTNQLRIEEVKLPNGRDIIVRAEGVKDLRNSYVEFRYNPAVEHPVNIEMGELMTSGVAPCLQQGFLNHYGVVPVAQVIVGGYANQGVTGSGRLFTITLANGPAERQTSAYDQKSTDPVVQNGNYDSGTKTVKWTNVFRGDCNANEKVDFADFGVIGAQYNKVVKDTPAAEVADADNKGKVDFADFGVVGAQYNKALDGWCFWYGADFGGTPPTTAPAETIKATETKTFTKGKGGRGFNEFSTTLDKLANYKGEEYMWVAPHDGTKAYPELGAQIKLEGGTVQTAQNIVDFEIEVMNILTEKTPKDGKATPIATARLLDPATHTSNVVKANDRFAVRMKTFTYEYTDDKDPSIKYETKYDVKTGKSIEHHKVGDPWAPDTTKDVKDLPAAYQNVQEKVLYTFGGDGVISVGGATTFVDPITGKDVEARKADVFITMDATDTVTRTATVTVELPAALKISKTALKFTWTNTVGADPNAPVITTVTENMYGTQDVVVGLQFNKVIAPDAAENEVVDANPVIYLSMVPWDVDNSKIDTGRKILVYKAIADPMQLPKPNPNPDKHTPNPTGTELIDNIYAREPFAIDGFGDYYIDPKEPTKVQFRLPLSWYKYYGTYRFRIWNGVYRVESGAKVYAHPSTVLVPKELYIGGLENVKSTVWPNKLSLDPAGEAVPDYPTLNMNPFNLIVYVQDPVIRLDGRKATGKYNMDWATPALSGIFYKGYIDGTTGKTADGEEFFLGPTFPIVMVQAPGATDFVQKDIIVERWMNRIAVRIPKGDNTGTEEEKFWGQVGTYKLQFRQNPNDKSAKTIMIDTQFTRTGTYEMIVYNRMPKVYTVGIYDETKPVKTLTNETDLSLNNNELSVSTFEDSIYRYMLILGENFGPFVESGADREGNKDTPKPMVNVWLTSDPKGSDAVPLERVMVERAEGGTRVASDGNQLSLPAVIKCYIPHDVSYPTGVFYVLVTFGDDPTDTNLNRHYFKAQPIVIKP